MILAERAARLQAEAVAASAKAEAADAKAAEALISYLKLEIEKLRRQIYGSRSERKARLLDQMELELEELEATATEDELAAERAAAKTQTVRSFQRKRPSRKPFPDHLPRERVVVVAPQSCPCCGSSKLSKLGEDITETLEVVPRQWKVIQTVREKFSCRDCETITQPPAPFHVTPRGFAGPNLLAINGQSAEERLRMRKERSVPLLTAWKRGCASSALGCGTRPRSPSQSITCCAAGTGLLASSMTHHGDADHDGKAQRHRSASLAGGRLGPHRQHPARSAQ